MKTLAIITLIFVAIIFYFSWRMMQEVPQKEIPFEEKYAPIYQFDEHGKG